MCFLKSKQKLFAGGKMFVKCLFVMILLSAAYAKDVKEEPRFSSEGSNVTVVEGRDTTLACSVENLQNFKVAWLRVDTQTILTIGAHVITKNHRVGVAKGESGTWALALRDVRPSDGGRYMCQINTEPMITQTHNLQVFVPPDIVDSNSSSEVMVREGDNVTLHCSASGTPLPSILWRREDSAQLAVGGRTVSKWSGAWLNMTSVSRSANGAFLCIATNGVPPSVSKRIMLHVLCKPAVKMTQKMIGGYLGEPVLLQCKIEANPSPVVHWMHIEQRLPNGSKYQASTSSQGYKHIAVLKINNVSRDDIGSYHCFADNSLGTASDDITVYTLAMTTVTTTESTTLQTTKIDTTTAELYGSLDPSEANAIDEENYVVVLSQHQMQSLDNSPSS